MRTDAHPAPAGPSAWPREFARTAADRDALVVLPALASMTPRKLQALASTVGSAAACLESIRRGRAGTDGDRRSAALIDPARSWAELAGAGARMVTVHEPEYPPMLFDLYDPPAALFVRGHPLPDLEPRVAVVGARNCTATGADVAGSLGMVLARSGVCVVSGAARGIDGAAHRGALEGGGRTIAVLGCGIDVAYPRRHAALLDRIVRQGAVVSEYPPGLRAEPFRFPARNRIVAALARGLVVVEGAPGSGSMISADHALDVGRDVFAVPGSVTSPLSAVPLALIRDGATMIRGPEDLLEDLGLAPGPDPREKEGPHSGAEPHIAAPLTPPQRAVWEALAGPAPPDRVAADARLALPDALSALVALELLGMVRQVGGRYERRAGAWSAPRGA